MSNLLAPGDYAITINPSTNPFCLYKIGTLDRNDNYNVAVYECNKDGLPPHFWKVQTADTLNKLGYTIEYDNTGQKLVNRLGAVGVTTGTPSESESQWQVVDLDGSGSKDGLMRIMQHLVDEGTETCLTLKYTGTTPPGGIPLDVEGCYTADDPNSVYQQFSFSPKANWAPAL